MTCLSPNSADESQLGRVKTPLKCSYHSSSVIFGSLRGLPVSRLIYVQKSRLHVDSSLLIVRLLYKQRLLLHNCLKYCLELSYNSKSLSVRLHLKRCINFLQSRLATLHVASNHGVRLFTKLRFTLLKRSLHLKITPSNSLIITFISSFTSSSLFSNRQKNHSK